MLNSMVKGTRGAMSVAVGLGLLVVALAADAAAFRTRFDPQFSTTFNGDFGVNLWWQGTAFITVPDACVTPLGSCSAGVTLDDYIVNFYNGDPSGSGTLLSSAVPGPAPNPTLVTFGADGVANGMDLLINLGTFTFGTGTFDADLSFATQYTGGVPVKGSTSLYLAPPCDDDEGCPALANQFAPTITWVPEPASVFLAGAALMALWLTRRRIGRVPTGWRE